MEILKQPLSFDPVLVRQILSRKCTTHPTEPCDLIYLSSNSKSSRICEKCKKSKIIFDSQVVSVQEVLQSSSETCLPVLYAFNPIQISQKIKFMGDSLDGIVKKIDSFYGELFSVMEAQLNESKVNMKDKIERLVNRYVQSVKSVKQNFSMGQLQDILVSKVSAEDEDTQLTEFFQLACKTSKTNKMFINDTLDSFQFMKDHFSSIQTKEIHSSLAKLFQEINIIPRVFLPVNTLEYGVQTESNLLLESLNVLSYMKREPIDIEVSSEPPGQILLTKNKNSLFSEYYLDYPLESTEKYILRVQFLQSTPNKQPLFTIAFFNDFGYKVFPFFKAKLNYNEAYGGGMMKVIRGQHLWSGNENIGDTKKIEFRIHIAKKLLKAASYPDYDNVVEIYNPSWIEQNSVYYIGLRIFYPNDGIRIIDFKKVREFDYNID